MSSHPWSPLKTVRRCKTFNGVQLSWALLWRQHWPSCCIALLSQLGSALVAWAIATLLAGLLALGAAQAASHLAAPAGGQSGAGSSVAGQNIIAFELDRLFRSERPPAGDMSYARAEASRILLTTASRQGMQDDDRAALARLVSARTGLAPAEVERRVSDVATRARDDINRARRSAVLIAFAAGVAALLGAAVAWAAGCAGGRDRDGTTPRTALSEWWHRPFSLRT